MPHDILRLKPATARPNASPLAPATGSVSLPAVAGVRFAVAEAGVRYKGRRDVMLAELAPGTAVAGTFTRSLTRAAPVLWCEEIIGAETEPGTPLAFIVNSGNANAFTGRGGVASVERVTRKVGEVLGCPARQVFTSSTGVIGEPLPDERISAVMTDLERHLSAEGAAEAAEAIMTTDTYPKGASVTVDLGAPVTITGIAKGSGMIAPDMGTMLVYIFTDAAIAQPVLQEILSELTDRTFNAITVDGDTSTSDTLLLAATAQAQMPPVASRSDPRAAAFADALEAVMKDLAHQVVRDGEGASKFVTINVTGAETETAARRIGLSIANSPLVKTALAGNDPNWGRIVMAVGKAGERADRDKLSIHFGDALVAENGWVSPDYREETGAEIFKRDEIEITVGVGVGEATSTVWTCDLTHAYITINADYRS